MNRIRAYVTLAVPVAGVERLLIETRASDPWVQLSVDAAEWVVGGYAQQWIGNRLEILDPGCGLAIAMFASPAVRQIR